MKLQFVGKRKYIPIEEIIETVGYSIHDYKIFFVEQSITEDMAKLDKLAQELNVAKCEGARLYPVFAAPIISNTEGQYVMCIFETLWG